MYLVPCRLVEFSDANFAQQLPEGGQLVGLFRQLGERTEPSFGEHGSVFGRVVVQRVPHDRVGKTQDAEHLEDADARHSQCFSNLCSGEFGVPRKDVGVPHSLDDNVGLGGELLLFARGPQRIAELALCYCADVLQAGWEGAEFDVLQAALQEDLVWQRKAPESGPKAISPWYVDAQTVPSGEPIRQQSAPRTGCAFFFVPGLA